MASVRLAVWAPLLLLASCAAPRPSPTLTDLAAVGDTPALERALEARADVNQRNNAGLTALILSARGGYTSSMRVLLRHGADPDRCGGVNGWTPLMHAVHQNQIGAAQLLLDGGAQVDRRGRSGETALMMAAGYGYTPLVELLMDRGADPRAETPDGANVLTIAASGALDIDHFTVGSCQAATIHALKRKDPSLHFPDNVWGKAARMALIAAKLRGCTY